MAITFTPYSPPASGGASLRFRALQMAAGETGYAQAQLAFPLLELTATGPTIGTAALRFLPLSAFAGVEAQAQALMQFAPLRLTARSEAEVIPRYAIGDGVLAPLTMWGWMVSIGRAEGGMYFYPLDMQASEGAYGASNWRSMWLYPLQLFGLDQAPRGNFLLDSRRGAGRLQGQRTERLRIQSTRSGLRRQGARRTEALRILIAETGRLRSVGVRRETLQIRSASLLALTAADRAGVDFTPCWVFNADSFAPSRYLLPFTEVVTHAGRSYAVGTGGLYELIGNDDGGAAIAASVQLARNDSQTLRRKSYRRLYVQGRGGKYRVTVQYDQGEFYTYRGERALDLEGNARAKLGRGPQSQFLRLLLRNIDGDDFHWHRVDLLPEPQRRVSA